MATRQIKRRTVKKVETRGQAWILDPTAVTAGEPGSFTPVHAVPANLAALVALGDLGETVAWAEGEHVILLDDSHAHWDGADWAEGDAPA